jgi:tetratricopeptide (TPR) repeat protein
MRQLTRALVDLGDLLQQRGRYRAAEPVLQEAIQVAEKAFGKDHLEVATPLNSLAVCYKYMARYLDAGPLYQRALAIETKVLGAHHPNVGVCLENYSSVLHSLGRRTAATRAARRAARILGRVEAVNDRAVAITGTINPEHAPFRLRVGRSTIHRLGVFADEPIPARRKVIEYAGERISAKEAQRRGNATLNYMFAFAKNVIIDGSTGGTGAEYINHSCAPNLRARKVFGHLLFFSVRAIGKGEELTLDYKYRGVRKEDYPCACGAPSCRGTLVEERRDTRRNRAPRRTTG